MTSSPKLIPLAVAALAFIAFMPALDAGFVNWDDPANVLGQRGLPRPRLEADRAGCSRRRRMAVYAPLAWVSLGVNYVLGGMDPWGYHLGNMLIHAGNTALFYLVARRLLRAAAGADASWGIDAGAALAALVFGAPSAAGGVGGVGDGAARRALRMVLPARRARLPPRGRCGRAPAGGWWPRSPRSRARSSPRASP